MRDINLLHPSIKPLAERFITLCHEKGLNVKITDTLRTKTEQDALYAQGRITHGSIVTNARYPRSFHNWGLAFDFCRNEKGREYDDSDGFFAKCGAVGKELGLTWGGNFTSLIDKPHLQLDTYGSTASELIAKYKTPDNLPNPNAPFKTIHKGSRGREVQVVQAFIGVDVDGIFGVKTDAGVKKFQSENNLVVDGWVGVNTWKKIASIMTGIEL